MNLEHFETLIVVRNALVAAWNPIAAKRTIDLIQWRYDAALQALGYHGTLSADCPQPATVDDVMRVLLRAEEMESTKELREACKAMSLLLIDGCSCACGDGDCSYCADSPEAVRKANKALAKYETSGAASQTKGA